MVFCLLVSLVVQFVEPIDLHFVINIVIPMSVCS